MRDLKYLAAYLIPALALFSIAKVGIYSYTTFVFVFLMIPLLEPVLGSDTENYPEEEQVERSENHFFDLLLLLNLPILYAIIGYFGYQCLHLDLSTFELIGLCLSVGLTMGALGINVAHELGHKPEKYKQLVSASLLLPSLYMHFTMEHNLGHHKNVATDEDPASARKGEAVYVFWVRSIIGTYGNAWKLQQRILDKGNHPFIGMHNKQLINLVLQVAYLTVVFFLGGVKLLLVAIVIALISILLLELINYIEHYGLRRNRLPNGRYELVRPEHSWNSNHELGRILLYELTRHSDHHFSAHKKYQNLDDHQHSRQLPFGYPTSMLLSLCPPFWFKIMDKRI